VIYTVATVVGVPNLPLQAYEQALASLRADELWDPPDDKPLLHFAKQFNADFPPAAAGVIATVLSREDLWDDPDPASHDEMDAEESSDTRNEGGEPESLRERVRREDLREDLRLADAQDYALEALALCGASAEQVAVAPHRNEASNRTEDCRSGLGTRSIALAIHRSRRLTRRGLASLRHFPASRE